MDLRKWVVRWVCEENSLKREQNSLCSGSGVGEAGMVLVSGMVGKTQQLGWQDHQASPAPAALSDIGALLALLWSVLLLSCVIGDFPPPPPFLIFINFL